MKKQTRGNNFRQITSAVPELADNEELKQLANELDDLQALASLSQSEGGKILVAQQISKASGLLRLIRQTAKAEHTHHQLIGLISRLDSCMDIVEILNNAVYNAGEQQDIVDQVVEANSQ